MAPLTINLPFLLLLASAALCSAARADVNTSFGVLRGAYLPGQDVLEFLGVPFAKAPVGPLRFQPPSAWVAPYPAAGLDATRYSKTCLSGDQTAGDEDCLYLNIWAPSNASNLPVMVYVHGGSFTSGSGSGFNGSLLADGQQVVVVTINYRLGSLGFLQVEAGLANFGMQDQREAFRWVQNQARSLGGDPTRVTIFGESAGAISVLTHLVLPDSAGLFQRVISESGMLSAYTQEFALANTATYTRAAGCGDKKGQALLSCLQALSVDEVKKAERAVCPPGCDPFTKASWSPCVDGVELVADPVTLMEQGRYAHGVPVLAGSNTNEGTLFIYPNHPLPMDYAAFKAFFVLSLNNRGRHATEAELEQTLAFYNPNTKKGADNRALLAQAAGDNTFICGTRHTVRLLSTYGEQVYMYRFNHRQQGERLPKVFGVYHGSEVPFVFGYNSNNYGPSSRAPADTALSHSIMSLWGRFAYVASPSANASYWPAYSNASDIGLRFETATEQETGYNTAACDYWEAFGSI